MTARSKRQRVRVLVFTIRLGNGGAEMQALRVANHLDPKRFDVQVAVMWGGGSYERLLRPGVPLHALGGRGIGGKPKELRKLIVREKPDVICSFLEIPNLVAAWAARAASPRPHVVACVQAPPSITWAGGGWKRALRALVSFYYGRAERIIAISAGVAHDIESMAPRARARTTVIFNAGVDKDVEEGAAAPLEPGEQRPDGPLLIGCGRLVEQKGFSYLLDAFALVRKQVPNANLWILGEGPDRPELEAQIERLSLGDAVRLMGFRDNPYRYMAAADLFVLSSIFEGFGNVIAEAMACGTAVVSTDCPYGPSEIITEGVNGLLVPPRDPPALAQAITRVLGDDGLRKRMVQEGRKRARDFDATAVAAEYGAALEQVVGGTKAEA